MVRVQSTQSEAYKKLKEQLGLSNADLLNFIKSKVIRNYDGENMALSLSSPERTK